MMPKKIIPSVFLICICLLFTQCEKEELLINDSKVESFAQGNNHNSHMKKPEGAGNCLSFPVIWAEGVPKALRPSPGVDLLMDGEWWYSWGTNGSDPNITAASCQPDPDEGNVDLNPDGLSLCDDGIPGSVDLTLVAGTPVADNPLPLAKAYVQKDPLNYWQGEILLDWPLDNAVDWIDWGDNLESVDWYTRSQVRAEVVLFEDNLGDPWLEYGMRHTSGWGIDEVHGMATDMNNVPIDNSFDPNLVLGTQATVYSTCARFTIQKFTDDNPNPDDPLLTWDADLKEWTGQNISGEDIIRPSIFNMAVHEAQDGPGYYNAEVNVKGRIIYGYTWNVRRLHDDFGGTAAGKYRLTFSFDGTCSGGNLLNTFFDGTTQIIVPLEEEVISMVALAETEDSGEGGGATPVLRTDLNLTYIDVNILERSGGGGGGGNGGGGGSKGGGNGGGRK